MLRVVITLGLAFSTSPLTGQVFQLSAPEVSGTPGQVVSAPIVLENAKGVVGFTLGIRHDPAIVELVAIQPGIATQNADQFLVDVTAAGLNGEIGGTVVARIDLAVPPLEVIPPATDNEIAVYEYRVLGSPGQTTPLAFCDCLGTPVVPNRLTLASTSVEPPQLSGELEVADVFRRGDANDDGRIDVSDAAFISRWLFGVGPSATCEDVGDVNDDGALQGAVDTVFLLNFLFQGGAPIPPPFPGCGGDATADSLRCAATDFCP